MKIIIAIVVINLLFIQHICLGQIIDIIDEKIKCLDIDNDKNQILNFQLLHILCSWIRTFTVVYSIVKFIFIL